MQYEAKHRRAYLEVQLREASSAKYWAAPSWSTYMENLLYSEVCGRVSCLLLCPVTASDEVGQFTTHDQSTGMDERYRWPGIVMLPVLSNDHQDLYKPSSK